MPIDSSGQAGAHQSGKNIAVAGCADLAAAMTKAASRINTWCRDEDWPGDDEFNSLRNVDEFAAYLWRLFINVPPVDSLPKPVD